jgi:hypothetical protein
LNNAHVEHEVMGQCTSCKDVFTVDVIDHRGERWAFAGSTATYRDGVLTHRCGGLVKLFSCNDIERTWPTWDPVKEAR